MSFNINNYEPVENRLKKFWQEYPNGRISTILVEASETRFIVKAEVFKDFNDTIAVTTGLAYEIIGSGPVNRTSALENCETSAIGRSLANWKFSGMSRASREEMEKVERLSNPAPYVAMIESALDSSDLELLKPVLAEAKKTLDPQALTVVYDVFKKKAATFKAA